MIISYPYEIKWLAQGRALVICWLLDAYEKQLDTISTWGKIHLHSNSIIEKQGAKVP